MSGSNNNNLTNPAVSASGEVDTLLIERFNNVVHEAYQKGENLLANFNVEEVTGTNMVSNKYIGDTQLQKLTPGQEPEATSTEMDKNALVVDTIVLGRNTVHSLHDIQSDVKVQQKLASNQMGKIKQLEDQMVIQQLLAGAGTGGVYDPYANTITGGVRRVSGHGVAIKVELNSDESDDGDPYKLIAAIEVAIMGLVAQRTPIQGMKIIVPIHEFGLLVDYGLVAQSQGGDNETGGMAFNALTGTLKGYGLPIMGSAEFTQMKLNPHEGADHHLLSNDNNGNRYDVLDWMKDDAMAVVFGPDALLAGRTISMQGDIYFDKKTKSYFIDSWMAEGAIPDRYDNIAVVRRASAGAGQSDLITAKAKGKAKATRTIA